jgi:hypothetical protein
MEFDGFLNAGPGAAQATASATGTATISLSSNAIFVVESQWAAGGFGFVRMRNSAGTVVFESTHPGTEPPSILDLPAGGYVIDLSFVMPSPGGQIADFTFTQVPEPAGAAVVGAASTAALLARRSRGRARR